MIVRDGRRKEHDLGPSKAPDNFRRYVTGETHSRRTTFDVPSSGYGLGRESLAAGRTIYDDGREVR